MRRSKHHLVGLVSCVAVFGGFAAAYRILNPPSPPPIEFRTPPPPAPPDAAEGMASLARVEYVALDMKAQKSYTTVTVERDPSSPAPERLWVWTYFFTPDGNQSLSRDPVEVRHPFESGDTRTVTVSAPCPWCGNPRQPTSGYYARVVVSTESQRAAFVSEDLRNYDIVGATPVVVQNGTGPAR